MGIRRILLVLVAAVVVGAVASSAWWVRREARAAMVEQVQQAELLAATERGGQLADALAAASARLATAVPLVQAGSLDAVLGVVDGMPGVAGATVRDADGAIVRSAGRPSPPAEGFTASDDRRAAWATVAVPLDGGGSLSAELDVMRLAPRLRTDLYGFVGTTSLVRRTGEVVMASVAQPGLRVQSPELLRILATGQPGTATYWSPVLQEHRIGTVAPVAGTDLMVVVGASRDAAHSPAGDLARTIAVALLAAIAASTAGAVVVVALLRTGRRELLREREDASHLAHTDPLTGIGNRRTFEAALDEAARGGGVVGVVLLDLDHLKQINDAHGHAAGDAAIQVVAAALASSVRSSDVVARIGGDEFAVVLPGCPEARARSLADAMCARVLATGGGVSVTAGVASGPAADVRRTAATADDRLYEGKRARPPAVLVGV